MILGGGIAAVLIVAAAVAWFTLRPASKKDTSLPLLPPVANNGSTLSPQGAGDNVVALSNQPPIKAQTQTRGPSGGGQAPQGNQSNPQPPAQTAPPPPPAATPQPPPTAALAMIPAGTSVAIRMIASIDSSRSRLGEKFDASVAEPVMLGGGVVIPRGAAARVELANATQSGHIEGRPSVSLELVSLVFGGHSYAVRSNLFQEQGGSRGKRSAEVIGGAAAAGAAIGGIFGHGKGAATGAAAGAAAGTGVQYATKGPGVVIPSETLINFTLTTPINVVR